MADKKSLIHEQVQAVLSEAAQARAEGRDDEASRQIADHILLLVRDRSNYVALGRGMGAVAGAVFGYLVTLLVPGGSLATMIPGLIGSGYLGERVGKYTGEKLSQEEYCDVLRQLHRELLMPNGTVTMGAEYVPFWKALLVLETPMDIFAPAVGYSFSGRLWRSLRRLFGSNLYPLAVEAAEPGTRGYDTLLAFARVLSASVSRDGDTRLTADHLYRHVRDDQYVNHLLGQIYYVDMAEYGAVRRRHRELFDEHPTVLFEADLAAHPDDGKAVRNLAQAYLEEGERTSKGLPVYRRAVELDIEPKLDYAVALIESIGGDDEAVANEQKAVERMIRHDRELLEGGRLTKDGLQRLLRLRALYVVEQGWREEAALEVCRRVFTIDPGLEANTLYLARVYLEAGIQDELRKGLLAAVFGLRARLSEECRATLLEEYEGKARSGTERLRLAYLLLEHDRADEAVEALQALRKDPGAALTPAEKLDSARLLAVANWKSGRAKRAYELFKGIALVEASDLLYENVFEFAVDLLTVQDRPTLARDAFVLLRSCSPEYEHPTMGSIDAYYRELQSVFDYYDEDSVRKLGGGGMAVIFEGREKTTGQTHIIKQLRTDLGTPSEIERFRRLFSSEIKAIKKLNESDHPGARHIVTLYHESADESAFSYSMEKLDEILSDRLGEGRRMPVEEAVGLLKDVGRGLACAHAEGVIHRDLNPRNIGFKDGVVKLFDFGTAHILRTTIHLRRAADPTPAERDAENVILGTPCYMSPEQAAGRQFDERTDIFSLACVAFEMLTGEMAFPGRLGSQVLTVGDGAGTLAELRGKLAGRASDGVIEVIMASLAPEPADRPDAVDRFVEVLG